jgi:hypothetical protein
LISGNRSARYSVIANLVNLWNAFGTGLRQKRMVASIAREFAPLRTKPTCNAPDTCSPAFSAARLSAVIASERNPNFTRAFEVARG